MITEVKEQWLEALRGDEYPQCKGVLHERKENGGYCCLGVLCDLAVKAGVIEAPVLPGSFDGYAYGEEKNGTHLPKEVVEWAGLDHCNPLVPRPEDILSTHWDNESGSAAPQCDDEDCKCHVVTLAGANDLSLNFSRIADLIEEHL